MFVFALEEGFSKWRQVTYPGLSGYKKSEHFNTFSPNFNVRMVIHFINNDQCLIVINEMYNHPSTFDRY